ncbi:hypothetical protein BCR35DRAFT_333473 [Leucosporidium creatinivorum]|uniref:RRM domain-containing protein n=1 Tax=Leucosporidium creatinivorum TaxID=106004 RepID=A0A1Y2ER18_9BASI|nr:hypothetical protein BCR35DRAFT_333473 [Leucosporidium creatinivorum]
MEGIVEGDEEDMELDSGSDEEVGAIVVAAGGPASLNPREETETNDASTEATTAEEEAVGTVGRDPSSSRLVEQEQLEAPLPTVKEEQDEKPFINARSTALSFSWTPLDLSMDVDTPTPPPRPASEVIKETRSFFETLDAALATSNRPHPLPARPHPLPARPQTPSELFTCEEEDIKPSLVQERHCSSPPRDTKPFLSRLPPTTSASAPPAPTVPSQPIFRPQDAIPARYTSSWSILYIVGLEHGIEHSRIWSLLSPPHLPPPLAICVVRVPASQTTLAYAAYSTSEDADWAKHGLTGTVHGREGLKLVAVDYERGKGVISWRWEMASEDFRTFAAMEGRPSLCEDPPSPRPSPRLRQPSPSRPRPLLSLQEYPQPPISTSNGPRSVSPPRPRRVKRPHAAAKSDADIVPSELLAESTSLHILNLPRNVTADDVYRYIDAPGLIGVAVRRQTQDDKRPGSAFLLFPSKNEGGQLTKQYLSKKMFPGGKSKMWYEKGKDRVGEWRWDEMSDAFVRQHAAAQVGAEEALRRRDRRRSASPRRRFKTDGSSASFGAPRPRSPPPHRTTRSPAPALQRQSYPPAHLPPRPTQTWSPPAPAPEQAHRRRHDWTNSASPPCQPPPPSSYDSRALAVNAFPSNHHLPAHSWNADAAAAAAAAAEPSAPSSASLPPWAPSPAGAQPPPPPPPSARDLNTLLASLDPSVLAQVQSQPFGAGPSADDEYDPNERLNFRVGGGVQGGINQVSARSSTASRWLD